MNSSKLSFDTKLFYNTVIFAIVSLRMLKAVAIEEQIHPRRVLQFLYHDIYDAAVVNIAKICNDKSGNDINRLLNSNELKESERQSAKDQWSLILKHHEAVIRKVTKIRNEIVAHFDKNFDSFEPQNKYQQEITKLDALLKDIKKFIEKLPWFQEDIIEPIQYTDIADDLGFNKKYYDHLPKD